MANPPPPPKKKTLDVSKVALNHVGFHVIAKKNRLRSAKNVRFSLLCILVDKRMRGLNPQPPLRTPLLCCDNN